MSTTSEHVLVEILDTVTRSLPRIPLDDPGREHLAALAQQLAEALRRQTPPLVMPQTRADHAPTTALHVPAARRGELHANAVAIHDAHDDETPGDAVNAGLLAAQLDGDGDTIVEAAPALLWRLLMYGLQDAGGEIHGLCEQVPDRAAIDEQMTVLRWYLDALDTIAALEPQEA